MVGASPSCWAVCGSFQHELREVAIVVVVEGPQLAEGSLQCQLWEAEVAIVVVVRAEELVEQEDSSHWADIARTVEAGEGIEDEDGVGSVASAADRDKRVVDSVNRTDVSMGVAAEMAAGSARQYAPWTPVWLEVEGLD